MRILISSLALAFVATTMISGAQAGAPKYIDGTVTFKFAGLDPHFPVAADACKAGVDDLVKHGNKKTFDSVKDGSSSTTLTCVVKETDGSSSTLGDTVTKILECPETTSARSTDNSGEFSKMRCRCDDAKKGCPAAPKAAPRH